MLLRERIGYGTIIDALLTGNLVQLYNNINPLPENHSMWIGIAAMLTGLLEPFREKAKNGQMVEVSEIKASYERAVGHTIPKKADR